jgi:hypothetical protein
MPDNRQSQGVVRRGLERIGGPGKILQNALRLCVDCLAAIQTQKSIEDLRYGRVLAHFSWKVRAEKKREKRITDRSNNALN